MRTYGANVDEMTKANGDFRQGSAQLQTSTQTISARLGETFWLGPAATTFANRWSTIHAPGLLRVGTSLETCARSLARNRDEQVRASAGGTVAGTAVAGTATLPAAPSSPPTSLSVRDRMTANRIQMQTELANGTGDIALIKKLLDSHVDVLIWDPQHGRIATVQGDIATAALVVITVPGTGANIEQYTADGKETARAKQIKDAAEATGKSTAVIAWLGYDAPQISLKNSPADESMAIDGGKQLAAFVNGLGLRNDQSVGVLGHSYGSTVAGHAATDGMRVDNLVVIGSPGLGVNSRGALGLAPGADVFSMRLPLDPIGGLSAFGTDPSAAIFGATRLAGSSDALFTHSDYWDGGNLDQLIKALTDGTPKTVVGPQTFGEAVIAQDQTIQGIKNRVIDAVQPVLPRPVEAVVDTLQGADQKIHGFVQTVATESVDITIEVTEKVGEKIGDVAVDATSGIIHSVGGLFD